MRYTDYTHDEVCNVMDFTAKVASDSEMSRATLICPTCGARPGSRCWTKSNDRMKRSHSERNQKLYRLMVALEFDTLRSFFETARLNGDRVQFFKDKQAVINGVQGRLHAQANDPDLDTCAVLLEVRNGQYVVLQVNKEEVLAA